MIRLSLFFVLMLSLPLQAKDSPCREVTQTAANECASDLAENANIRLEATYLRISNELYEHYGRADDSPGRHLAAAHMLWPAFLESSCQAEAALYQGGSVLPLIYYLCKARMTDQRVTLVEAQFAPN